MNQQFLCVKCKQLPIDAVETPCCASILCWECAVGIVGNCVHCSLPFDREACRINLPIRRVIDSIPRKCTFGCNKMIEGKDLQEHLLECPERKVSCPNSVTCGKLSYKDVDSHLKSNCEFRVVGCHLCDQRLILKDLKNHLEKDCEGVTVDCPNHCSLQMKRKGLEEHLQECPLQRIICEFADCGCDVVLNRQNYRDHVENPVVQRLHLLLLKRDYKKKLNELAQQQIQQQHQLSNQFNIPSIKINQEQLIGLKQKLSEFKRRVYPFLKENVVMFFIFMYFFWIFPQWFLWVSFACVSMHLKQVLERNDQERIKGASLTLAAIGIDILYCWIPTLMNSLLFLSAIGLLLMYRL